MTRKSYVIDVNKTVFPFGQEYWPNKAEPINSTGRRALTDNITAVGLKNVLPTPFGHSSFFGTTQLGNLKLPPVTEKVFTYKDSLGNNTLVALGKYGAMFSTDGVLWNESEVPNWVTQTATGSYEFQPDMAKAFSGFTKCTATFTKASPLLNGGLVEVTPQVIGTTRQSVIVSPVTLGNTYHTALSIDVNYAPSEVFTRLQQSINPGINVVTAGNTYVLSVDGVFGRYTAVEGDTKELVVGRLGADFIQNSSLLASGVNVEVLNTSEIRLSADPSYSVVSLAKPNVYEVPSTTSDTAPLFTLGVDKVVSPIPLASQGNLGYMQVHLTQPLVDGKFQLYTDGDYQVGFMEGLPFDAANIADSTWGDLTFPTINGLGTTKLYFALTMKGLAFDWSVATTQSGFTVSIHDTGIPLTASLLGASSTAAGTRLSCNMVAADVVVGRPYILQTLGQLGTYTAILGDSITSIVAGTVAAYNLAGVSIATQYGTQLVTSTATDELFFQPSPLATMVSANTNTEFMWADSLALQRNFVSDADIGQLYSLEFNNGSPSTGVTYTIYSDSSPVPVTSPLGAWTDTNYQLTSAQITAATLAGTKLFVRLNAKHLVVTSSVSIGGNLSFVGFRFRKVLAGNSLMSSHVGPAASFIRASAAILDHYQVYTSDALIGQLARLSDVPVDANTALTFSPYTEGVANVASISVVGLTPDTPTVDVFQFNAPLQDTGLLQGSLVDLQDAYTPNKVTVDYIHPITALAGNVVTNRSLASGRLKLTGNTIPFLPADLITFNTYNPWTFTIIRNRLYCYRNGQGVGTYILRLLENGTAWEQLTPTFANMAQMEGITSARGRMIMWDTTGSIYVGSNTTPTDFTPAIKTGANVYKVDAVRGNIILCQGYKDGYIIYSTASIIAASYVGNTTTFKHTTISNEQGILNTKAVTVADNNLHFAYTQAGLFAITAQSMQAVSPEASAYFKSSPISPKLDYIENRYLSIAIVPTIPSWVVSKWEAYAGATLKGLPVSGIDLSGVPLNLDLSIGQYVIAIPRLSGIDFLGYSQVFHVADHNNAGDIQFLATFSGEVPSYHYGRISDYLAAKDLNSPSGIETQVNYRVGGSDLFPVHRSDVIIVDADIRAVYAGGTVDAWVAGGMVADAGYSEPRVPVKNGWQLPSINFLTVVIDEKSLNRLAFYYLETAIAHAMWVMAVAASEEYTNRVAIATLMVANGSVYMSGNVYLNSPTTGSEVDNLGNIVSHNEVLKKYPVVIGTAPIGLSFSFTAQSTQPTSSAVPLNTSAASIPAIVIPGGQFIASQGVAEPVDAIYTRALLLDTELKNWGSCDVPFRTMMDFVPINARATNPVTGSLSTKFTFQNLAKSFALMKQDGTLNLCTQQTTDSYIEFGDIGFTNTGATRFLDALANFATDTGAILELSGSVNGEQLSPLFSVTGTSKNAVARIHKVLTCQWFRLRVSGRFDLKQITFSGESGGTR